MAAFDLKKLPKLPEKHIIVVFYTIYNKTI